MRTGLRGLVLALTAALAFTGLPVATVLALEPSEITSLTIASSYDSVVLPETSPVRITAIVPGMVGDVTFERANGLGWSTLGTASVNGAGWAELNTGMLGGGEATIRATYLGSATHDPSEKVSTFQIVKAVSQPNMFGTVSTPANVEFSVGAEAGPGSGGLTPTGTFVLKNKATGEVLGSKPLGQLVTIPGQPAGSFTVVAEYSGDANFEPATNEHTVSIAADTVDATNVGVSSTSIYPYKDGYKDTVAIRGTRHESSSVSIRVYNSSNRIVKSASIASGLGAYSSAWTGRNSAGTMLAAGKYRVVQVLRDLTGTTKTFTHYVTLSTKRIAYRTVYITKNGSAVSAKGDPGNGSITLSSSGLATLKAGSYPSGWVGVGWQFTLPTAAVYKSIAFQAYVKGPRTAPANGMGMQNFTTCPYSSSTAWNEACFSLNANPAATSYTWITSAGSVTKSRYGRTARGMISVNVGTVYVSKVRIKLVYGVLV